MHLLSFYSRPENFHKSPYLEGEIKDGEAVLFEKKLECWKQALICGWFDTFVFLNFHHSHWCISRYKISGWSRVLFWCPKPYIYMHHLPTLSSGPQNSNQDKEYLHKLEKIRNVNISKFSALGISYSEII